MTDIALDLDTGDIDLVDGSVYLTTGIESVRQSLIQRIRLFRGEWFLDLSEGVPYYEDILKKKPDIYVVDAAFKATILETPGVIELVEYELDYSKVDRTLSLSFKARSDDGIIDFSEELEIG